MKFGTCRIAGFKAVGEELREAFGEVGGAAYGEAFFVKCADDFFRILHLKYC